MTPETLSLKFDFGKFAISIEAKDTLAPDEIILYQVDEEITYHRLGGSVARRRVIGRDIKDTVLKGTHCRWR